MYKYDSTLQIVTKIPAIREQVKSWRHAGEKIAFVPTMGALHAGHLSLVENANDKADRTIVSIFVNPTQFAPGEDLSSYPRQEDDDIAKLTEVGCDLVFLPAAIDMYPPDANTSVSVSHISSGLCGTSRPHFFGGVATIVCKLLNICTPDFAIFGEKDFQQLLVIRQMVKDLNIDTTVIGSPLIREPDGLAMSSRNAYLSIDERKTAGNLNVVIRDCIKQLAAGSRVEDAIGSARNALLEAGFSNIDYLEVRNETNLSVLGPEPLPPEEWKSGRLFAAAMLGKTRLIDNMRLKN